MELMILINNISLKNSQWKDHNWMGKSSGGENTNQENIQMTKGKLFMIIYLSSS